MAEKVMLEVTQSLVSGNEVVVHAGELFEPGAKLPEGVTVRPVLVGTPGKGARAAGREFVEAVREYERPRPAPDKPAQDKPAADKPAAKTQAK